MRILVTNDDGVHASGIEALANAMAALGEVWIVAPEHEQSGTSHSLSLHRPLRLRECPAFRKLTIPGFRRIPASYSALSAWRCRPRSRDHSIRLRRRTAPAACRRRCVSVRRPNRRPGYGHRFSRMRQSLRLSPRVPKAARPRHGRLRVERRLPRARTWSACRACRSAAPCSYRDLWIRTILRLGKAPSRCGTRAC